MEQLRDKKPVKQIINGKMERGEEVLWHEQPIPKYALWSGFPGKTWFARSLYILCALIAIQPFSLSGFYISKVALQTLFNPSGMTSFFAGFCMTILGLILAIGPYHYAIRARVNSCRNAKYAHYVLTNRRAMLLYIKKGKIEEERIKSLHHISNPWIKMVNSKGIGDVIYDAGGAVHNGGDGPEYSSHYDIGFEGVANAEAVLELLNRCIATSRKKS